jgi:hypothetical protein
VGEAHLAVHALDKGSNVRRGTTSKKKRRDNPKHVEYSSCKFWEEVAGEQKNALFNGILMAYLYNDLKLLPQPGVLDRVSSTMGTTPLPLLFEKV